MELYAVAVILLQIKISFGDPLLTGIGVPISYLTEGYCVPTNVVVGPCHVCVCTTRRIYHCRLREKCDEQIERSHLENECLPLQTYRHDDQICSCTKHGQWTSNNCRNKFHKLQSQFNSNLIKLKTDVDCEPDKYYLMACNICRCTESGKIDLTMCTQRQCVEKHKADKCSPDELYNSPTEVCSCSEINYYVDKQCLKIEEKLIQQINESQLNKLISVGKNWSEISQNYCNQYKSGGFQVDCNVCGCKGVKLDCTTFNCAGEQPILRSRSGISPYKSMPALDDKCKPDTRYRHKCNTCWCNKVGRAICTTMLCAEDIILSREHLRRMSENGRRLVLVQ